MPNVVSINMDEVFRLIGLKEILLDQAQRKVAQLEAKLENKDATAVDTNGSNVPGPKDNGRT